MGKKIIVIDDSRTARQQVASTLVGAGFQVIEAVDGRDGLEKIAAHSDASLVICDVNMPNVNGLEMLAKIHDAAPSVQTPIIMLTTEAQPELLQQAKRAGAKGWIVKPFRPEMLVAAARRLAGG